MEPGVPDEHVTMGIPRNNTVLVEKETVGDGVSLKFVRHVYRRVVAVSLRSSLCLIASDNLGSGNVPEHDIPTLQSTSYHFSVGGDSQAGDVTLEGDDPGTVPTAHIPQSTAHILTDSHNVVAVRVELAAGDGAGVSGQHSEWRRVVCPPHLGGSVVGTGGEVG